MSPLTTPAPACNQQATILAALSKGTKLYDILRTEGMPRKATLDEWLSQDPDYRRRFESACTDGRGIRDQHGEAAGSDRNRPAVLRGPRSARLATQPISDFVRKPAPSPPAPPFMQVVKDTPVTPSAPAPTAGPPATPLPKAERKERALEMVEAGRSSGDTQRELRINSAQLAEWRRDPAFLARWSAVVRRGGARDMSQVRMPGAPRTRPAGAPYLYLRGGSSSTASERTLEFKRKRGGRQVIFATDIQVLVGHWDEVRGLVLDSHPDAAAINRQILAINALASEAMDEGRTQDEIRQLLDVPATRSRLPASGYAVTQPPRAYYTDQQPAPVAAADSPGQNRESYDDDQDRDSYTPSPEPMPEETPAAAPAAAEPAFTPTVGTYLVGSTVFDTEDAAMLHAWDWSKRTGQPATIYRLAPVAIGTVNAHPRPA